jgi:plastocyanin
MQNTISFLLGVIVVVFVAGAGYYYFVKDSTNDLVLSIPETETQTATVANINDATTTTATSTSTTTTTTSTTTATATATAKTITVTYSDSGFSPKSVEIAIGDTVKFVNNSKKNMWVASDPHPAHSEYPDFDQKASSAKGTSFSFTFTKAGNWKYHNHKQSSDTGVVVVK